jgi:hypothetical protein
VRGVCTADILNPFKRVKVFWEMHNNGLPSPNNALIDNGVTEDPDWPLRVTEWTRYYLVPGNSLSTTPSTAAFNEPYLSGTKRAGAWSYLAPADIGGSNFGAEVTTANLPDEMRFTASFPSETAIAGPINVTLFASSTAPDTEFYVELDDLDTATGAMTRLQRGMQKASHRKIDPLHTDYNDDGDIIRAYHPHTNTTLNLLTPGTPTRFEIEVFPLGHVFRAGHKLVVRISAPPVNDSLATYIPTTPPAVNSIFYGGIYPSSILLPVVPNVTVAGPDLGCGKQVGLERCSVPVN